METTSYAPIIVIFKLNSLMLSWEAKDLRQASTDFIIKSCTSTRFPQICERAMLPHAGHVPFSAKFLVKVALELSSSSSESAIGAMAELIQGKQIADQSLQASKDCLELLGHSRYNLYKTIVRLQNYRKGDFKLLISEMKAWVSAALTDDNTCTDALSDVTLSAKLKIVMDRKIVYSTKLITVALELINVYASAAA